MLVVGVGPAGALPLRQRVNESDRRNQLRDAGFVPLAARDVHSELVKLAAVGL